MERRDAQKLKLQRAALARRAGGHAGRKQRRSAAESSSAVHPGLLGGSYRPLRERDMQRIHQTALDVLENIGMASPIPILREHALAKGCRIDARGRLCFPRALVEDVLASAPRSYVNHARDPRYDIEMSGARVHFDPGGESVLTLDFASGRYRPSTLIDLYDFARLVDRLDHVHMFSRVVSATEIPDLFANDINTAYASMAGTAKHIHLSFSDAKSIDAAIAMMDLILGGEGRHLERPFCTSGGCPVVSPLTYGEENSEVCIAATRMGGSVGVVIAPQAGATAPAALAGTLVQTVAETLAALLLVNLVVPGHPVGFGPWPFVSDLRTGAFSGGGGEAAVLNAAAAQIGRFYGLPTIVGAGMTDSKLPDNQAGYEKGVSVALAALAGANIVSETSGMLGSLMGCSFEAMVIDNEMLGCIQRALRGIEVTDETLSYEVIRDVAYGEGHFLGHPQTLQLMETEYLYPEIADRTSPSAWEEAGGHDLRERARQRARQLLASHYPEYIDRATDEKIRARFPIALPREAMRPGNRRW
ncbi:MAG: trimethylamine methyltransferase family protein [Myxococcales bacterium]|nr:trimethylamine methyltransferase family protein [Myxococcales bacterium]MDH5567010.1 trimethylamine methyltransferase family protein [Myxococcales bacterium]